MKLIPNKFLSCFHLKIFAVVCMIADHIAVVLMWPSLPLYTMLRSIGRMAFPLYAFLVVESCNHTKSMEKYLIRLGLFALISEIPFDLAFSSSGEITFFDNVNIFFTLLFSVASIYVFETIRNQSQKIKKAVICFFVNVVLMCFISFVTGDKRVFIFVLFLYLCSLISVCHIRCREDQKNKNHFGNFISIVLILPIFFLGEIIDCDYGVLGIILIVCTYMTKYIYKQCTVQIFAIAIGMIYKYGIEPWSRWMRWGHIIGISEIMYLCFSLLAVVILIWYNGERGKNVKWSFYLVYPVHVFALYLLKSVFS